MVKKKQEAPEGAPDASTIETPPGEPEKGQSKEETRVPDAIEITNIGQLSVAYPDLVEQLAQGIREGIEGDLKAEQHKREQVEAERIAKENADGVISFMAALEALSETPFGKLVIRLSDDEIKALDTLEAAGWKMFMEAKLEDVKEKSGRRQRTFRNQGRYDLVAALKKVDEP